MSKKVPSRWTWTCFIVEPLSKEVAVKQWCDQSKYWNVFFNSMLIYFELR